MTVCVQVTMTRCVVVGIKVLGRTSTIEVQIDVGVVIEMIVRMNVSMIIPVKPT